MSLIATVCSRHSVVGQVVAFNFAVAACFGTGSFCLQKYRVGDIMCIIGSSRQSCCRSSEMLQVAIFRD